MAQTPRKTAEDALQMALACGATIENAARKAGLSERTVSRRLADPAFCAQIVRRRAEMAQRTTGLLTVAGMSAVKALVDLEQDPAVSPAVRRLAARDLLELGLRFREADLEPRVSAIEDILSNPPADGSPAGSSPP